MIFITGTRHSLPDSPGMDARYVCARVITEVIRNHRHLDTALRRHLPAGHDSRESGLVREICYGVLRWHPRLEFITGLLLGRPLKRKDTDILALIYSGLYQLMFLRVPDHAAISATVDAADRLEKPWAKDLINAVLRRYQRDAGSIQARIQESEAARYAHPQWLITVLQRQWPDCWRQILEANNEYPPLHLRVNHSGQSRDHYLQRLKQAGIGATASRIVSTGIRLCKPVNAESIPGFKDGTVSVQDYGAQLAVPLLDVRPGQRVLEACAAPGGKTGHISEHAPGIDYLLAIDSDADRIEMLRNTAVRLDLKANIVQADINAVGSWWDGKPFDRILLDAPCSATGVIRRHPDIKYLRSLEQINIFIENQQRLLSSLWPVLKSGGKLLYSTCSVLKEEGDDQIATFLDKYDDAMHGPLPAEWGSESRYGRYILPGQDDTDGFYYSAILKTS